LHDGVPAFIIYYIIAILAAKPFGILLSAHIDWRSWRIVLVPHSWAGSQLLLSSLPYGIPKAQGILLTLSDEF
jgi:predicted MFS family arabinose efflux permease